VLVMMVVKYEVQSANAIAGREVLSLEPVPVNARKQLSAAHLDVARPSSKAAEAKLARTRGKIAFMVSSICKSA
jgi:hypothetical protein